MSNLDLLMSNRAPFFLTDGGLETWLIFQRGIELREFASFEMLQSNAGRTALSEYFQMFLMLAEREGKGFVLDTPTWRASPDWCRKLGFGLHEMEEINRAAAAFARTVVAQLGDPPLVVVNGAIGPRGDGYVLGEAMSAEEARSYHGVQVAALAGAGADMVSATTMTNLPEAIGIANAARDSKIPCVVSFTVETDGRLPTGQALGEAVQETDAVTANYPLYYMINCAHPDHFRTAVSGGETWTNRIGGIRANASRMSHAELDVAVELDDGDPQELGALHGELLELLPNIRVFGGCCGTDHRHVACMAGYLPQTQAA